MRTWLRLLLILLTVGGGFTGFVLTLQLLGEVKSQGTSRVIVALIFLGMYSFVTFSGLLFVHDHKRTRPVLISLAMQLPWISSPVFVYQFAAGLYAAITLGTPDEADRIGLHFGWNFFVGSHFLFRVWDYREIPWTFGINFVPLILIVLLLRSSALSDTKQHHQTDSPISVAV